MYKKILSIFILLFLFNCAVSMAVKQEAKRYHEAQKYINEARDLEERYYRTAEVFAGYIEESVRDIVKEKKWDRLKLPGDHLYLILTYSYVTKKGIIDIEPFLDPLKLSIYKDFSHNLETIINRDKFLNEHVDFLYLDTKKLEKYIDEEGDPVFSQEIEIETGMFAKKNAFFEINLDFNWADKRIKMGGKMVSIVSRKKFGNVPLHYLKADRFIDDFIKRYPNRYPPRAAVVIVPGQVKPGTVKEVKTLAQPTVWYRATAADRFHTIKTGQRVNSHGQLSFEITLPKLGGYLLVYSQDSTGKMFNLFPGTRTAIVNGDYQVPYHLIRPTTEIHKLMAESTTAGQLAANKVQTPVYEFDEERGVERFYFYYSGERNKKLEEKLGIARNTRKDLSFVQMKGIEDKAKPFKRELLDISINEAEFYHAAVNIELDHD